MGPSSKGALIIPTPTLLVQYSESCRTKSYSKAHSSLPTINFLKYTARKINQPTSPITIRQMTEPKKKPKGLLTETSKTWSHRTVGVSNLMAKEGELVEYLRNQRTWAKEQLMKLVEKKEDLLDVLREQGK